MLQYLAQKFYGVNVSKRKKVVKPLMYFSNFLSYCFKIDFCSTEIHNHLLVYIIFTNDCIKITQELRDPLTELRNMLYRT